MDCSPTRLLCPWVAPGRSTGVGCHFLLQGIVPTQGSNLRLLYCRWILYHLSHQRSPAAAAAKSLQLCPTVCDPIDGSPPGFPSLGFSRQEYWSGLPFPSPMRESEVARSCPTLSDPVNCSPPVSSIHGIFQARVLEWGAIAFSLHLH